jgi:hypothetical protein
MRTAQIITSYKTRTQLVLMVLAMLLAPAFADATTDCSFTTIGTTMKLNADCATDATILVPDGFTLDGRGKIIMAVDPPAGHFVGAVISNAGTFAKVRKVIVDTSFLANLCDAGADRLRGIMFDGASGEISDNTVLNINQGASGCQEGNGIEVRNPPFDGTHPATKIVEVLRNKVFDYQKTGIVANGDVDVTIRDNIVGASATQANLAANGIQVGFGGIASVRRNLVEGNTWLGFDPVTSEFSATAVLLFEASPTTEVRDNNINLIGGNADTGIHIQADSVTVRNNRVFDNGPDTSNPDDIGIDNPGHLSGGVDNTITGNKARCYETGFRNVSGAGNVVLPCAEPAGPTSLAAGSRSPSPSTP